MICPLFVKVGYAMTAYDKQPVIGFDMGGQIKAVAACTDGLLMRA